MPTLVIKSNASQATDVTIRDMGIIIPNSGGSETFTDIRNFQSATDSFDLQNFVTDNAFGVNSSTLILADGTNNIAQGDALNFLNQISNNTRVMQATVDFGFSTGNEGDTATVTVNTTWVTSSSQISCLAYGGTTTDHDPDDPVVEGIVAYAQNIVVGVSFDIVAYAPQNTWGKYLINATIS